MREEIGREVGQHTPPLSEVSEQPNNMVAKQLQEDEWAETSCPASVVPHAPQVSGGATQVENAGKNPSEERKVPAEISPAPTEKQESGATQIVHDIVALTTSNPNPVPSEQSVSSLPN